MPEIGASPAQWSSEEIRRVLPRPIPPVKLAPLYLAGLPGLVLLLAVLQAIYLALIAGAAWLTWQYLLILPGLISEIRINLVSLPLLAAPAVAGVITTFFLFKPLLSRPPKPPEPVIVTPETAPLLHEFVARLSSLVGARPPERIEVDLQVNAFARLHRGWLGFFTGRLDLRIGLPLISGLSTAQFAGVLAHEFGHFSQRAGLRLHFLAATMRGWFARVAHDRDRFDLWLWQTRESSGWRLKAVLWVADLAVTLSRAVLRGLLWLANLASAWFSRQMEFDADRHEAALVGAEVFEQTTLRMPLLELSHTRGFETVEQAWQCRELADNLVPVLLAHAQDNSPELLDAFRQALFADASTGRWATHPSPAARVANVQGFHGTFDPPDLPAEGLFPDYQALCRQVSLHLYQQNLGDESATARTLPAAGFIERQSEAAARAAARRAFFGAIDKPHRWFLLSTPPPEDLTIHTGLDYDDSGPYWSLLTESLHRSAALEFVRVGGRIEPGGFHLDSGELPDIARDAATSRAALRVEMDRLRTAYAAAAQLMQDRPQPLLDAYRALSSLQDILLDLRHLLVARNLVEEHAAKLGLAEASNARSGLDADLRRTCLIITTALDPVPDPSFPRSLSATLVVGQDIASLSPTAAAAAILDASDALGDRLLGDLCRFSPPETTENKEPAA